MSELHQLTSRISGPDFLEEVAEKERALGNDVNADTFQARADQWRRDLAAAARAEELQAGLDAAGRRIAKLSAALNAVSTAVKEAA